MSRRLKHVSRCSQCGAWIWKSTCTTPHKTPRVRRFDDSPEDLGGRWVSNGRGIRVWKAA